MSSSGTKSRGAAVRGSHAQHGVSFLKEFLARPTKVGAVAPSSPRLCKRMVGMVDLSAARAVVEFGPGTGVCTDEILPKLPKGCTFFAVELSPSFAQIWRTRHPTQTLYCESAAEIAAICRKEGVEQIDAIFSGLPWASFPEPLQRQILDATLPMLKPGGSLVTFAYSVGRLTPAGRRFAKLLPEYFPKIEHSRVVWRNLPPAFVIKGTK
jgi:phosphatidylethanolamine/phosphatidyl-N-methylethanolamine N-methyltransferase